VVEPALAPPEDERVLVFGVELVDPASFS